MAQLAYVNDLDQVQVIDKHYDGSAEVYNFLNSYTQAHSHIHYPNIYNPATRIIHRDLNNPINDVHGFYPIPGSLSWDQSLIPVSKFQCIFEQIKSMNLDELNEYQLNQILEFLEKSKQEISIVEKTR